MFKWKDNRKFSKKDFVRLFLNRGSGVKGSKFMRLSQLDQKLHFVVACQAREYFTKYIIVTKDSFCETAFLLCGHTCQELDIGPSIPSQCWNQLSAVPPLSFNMLLQFIILSRNKLHECIGQTKGFFHYRVEGDLLWEEEIDLKFEQNFISGHFWLCCTECCLRWLWSYVHHQYMSNSKTI